MRLKPQHPSRGRRIDAGLLPPSGLIAAAVDRAMVSATQGHSEFIADLAPQSPALGKAQVRAPEGWRPQTRQGRLATARTCARSRTRRGSGKISKLLSTDLDRPNFGKRLLKGRKAGILGNPEGRASGSPRD
jgi:hypothetical protein